ncbi:MAG: GAF domain-containing protein [Thermodesulfobacteriota bacterium]
MTPPPDPHHSEQQRRLLATLAELPGGIPPMAARLLDDAAALYRGDWPGLQSCQVGYHTFGHALDVALAAARMMVGFHRSGTGNIDERLSCAALAAALFHDAGYIKDAGDPIGTGGKYTFVHVQRSMNLARGYLRRSCSDALSGDTVELVVAMIAMTEFNRPVEIPAGLGEPARTAACMVASADLIAQMADPLYIEHLDDLFAEFREGYDHEGVDALAGKGVHVFASVEEMLAATPQFYERFVVPRLERLGSMSRYLAVYYGEQRNPYLENIAANLAGKDGAGRLSWQRLGEILVGMGLISDEQLTAALLRQKQPMAGSGKTDGARRRGISWLDGRLRGRLLGDVLLRSQALSAEQLWRALLVQVIPEGLSLSAADRLHLLHLLLLLQHIGSGDWLFAQVVELLAAMLRCRGCAIRLADRDRMTTFAATRETTIHPATIDKGLAGWVYLHGESRIIRQREGIASETRIAVPLRVDGRTVGAVEAAGPDLGEHDLDLLTVAATIIGNSLAAALWLDPTKEE